MASNIRYPAPGCTFSCIYVTGNQQLIYVIAGLHTAHEFASYATENKNLCGTMNIVQDPSINPAIPWTSEAVSHTGRNPQSPQTRHTHVIFPKPADLGPMNTVYQFLPHANFPNY